MTEYKRIQLRRDTSNNWATENPVLLEGEIGIDLTSNNIKIGDGLTAWNVLDYVHSDVDLSNYYTKGETNNAIQGTRTALEGEINVKVDTTTYEGKISEIETNLEGKADKADTYTKGEVDEKIAGAGVSKEYVDGEISRVESEIPSLSGYATEAWVEGKGYLTEHQPLDDYYTKEEIDVKQQAIDNAILTKADAEETANRFSSVDDYLEQLHTDVEGKADTDSVPTKTSELTNDSGFLTEHQSLEGYATEQWVEGKGYLTEHQSLDNYYTKTETDTAIQGVKETLQDEINVKVDTTTYEGKISEIETNLEGKADKADTYTKGEVDEKIAGAGVSKEYVDGEISRVESEIPSLSGYATEAWVEGKGYLTEHQPLDDYYTKEEIDGKVEAIDNAIATKADQETVDSRFSSVDEYLSYLQTAVESKADVSELEYYVLKGDYEVKVNDIDNAIATKADAEETANRFSSVDEYLEQLHSEIEGKADTDSVPTKTSELTNDSGFLTEHQSLEGYATEQWVEGKGYLTEHQSLDNYYTKTETDTAIQGVKETLQDEINVKVDTTTYEGKISEIEEVLDGKADRTEIPSLAGYATEQWVEDKGYLTEHQPLKTINGEEIVGEGNIEIQGGGGNNWYGTEEEFKALGEYDETGNTLYHIEGQIDFKTDIKNIPLIAKKVSQLPNDAHYIQDVKKINGISMRGKGDIDIMKIIDKYHWWGTQEEYDQIEEKDAKVQYHIEGDVPSNTETWTFELEDGTTTTKQIYIK